MDVLNKKVIDEIYSKLGSIEVNTSGTSSSSSNTSSAVGQNSSVSPLGIGATFTGQWELNTSAQVQVSCVTDASGTLYFDFSNDGITTHSTFPSNGFSVTASINEFHVAVKSNRYFRVRLVNGSTAQTTLSLLTVYGMFGIPNAPLNQTLGKDQDAIIVRTIDPIIDEALGRLGGVRQRDKFGYARNLGTGIVFGTPSTWVDLWFSGGLRTVPSSTFTPYAASDDSGDTSIDVEYTYFDSNNNEVTATFTTDASDGRTPVSLAVTAREIQRAYVIGSTECVGNIYITTANDFTNGVPDNQDEILVSISAEDQQSQLLAFRVPADKIAIINGINISCARSNGSSGSVILAVEIREPGTSIWRAIRPYMLTTSESVNNGKSIVLESLTDLRVRIRDVSDSSTDVFGIIDYKLVDE